MRDTLELVEDHIENTFVPAAMLEDYLRHLSAEYTFLRSIDYASIVLRERRARVRCLLILINEKLSR